MEELNQEIQIENQIEEIIEPSLQALQEGKITFKDIPKEKRHEIRMQARDNLPNDRAKEAFDMGWSPKEFFLGKRADGSEKPFVDYEEFLTKINETAPVKNERLRTLTKENQEKDRQLEEMRAEVRKLFELNKAREEREFESQEARLKAEIEEAEELGDIKTFKDRTLRLNRLEQEKLKLKSFEPEQEINQTEAPQIPAEILNEVQTWTAKNSWYFSDVKIQNFCNAQSALLAQNEPELSLSERLEIVKQMAFSRFPELAPAKTKAAVLSSKTSGLNATAKPSISFEQLPEAEKKTAEWMLKMGVYKSKAEVVQAYMKREQEKKR